MQAGQSAPGQIADAIKNADPHRLREPTRPVAISHGHENDASPLPWPDHIIREGQVSGSAPPELTGNVNRYPAESHHGTETATDPS